MTVHYATADGTATAGDDYTPVSGTLTFDPSTGQTTLPVSIPILADTVPDDDETVLVNLSAPVNGVLQRATATLTITDSTATPGVRPSHPGAAAGHPRRHRRAAWIRGGRQHHRASGFRRGRHPSDGEGGCSQRDRDPTRGRGAPDGVPLRRVPSDHEQPELQRGPDDREHGGRGVAGQWQGLFLHHRGSPTWSQT